VRDICLKYSLIFQPWPPSCALGRLYSDRCFMSAESTNEENGGAMQL